MSSSLFWSSSISIHAPHTGRDGKHSGHKITSFSISIPAPHTGRDTSTNRDCSGWLYFNPRAPYGARRRGFAVWSRLLSISIHAPHTGRDEPLDNTFVHIFISIHAPHTGRDLLFLLLVALPFPFQSTRPIRGATKPGPPTHPSGDISIHAPHTGRDSKNA